MRVHSIRQKCLTLKDIRAKNHHKKVNRNNYALENFKTVTVSEEEMARHREKIASRSYKMDKQLNHAPFEHFIENFIKKFQK